MTFDLPSAVGRGPNGNQKTSKSKKRKRAADDSADSRAVAAKDSLPPVMTETADENDIEIAEDDATKLEARLKSLAALQTRMLTFAFTFPSLTRITYSTCSVHDIENEGVVVAALASAAATSRGWRLLRREQQIDGMRRWDRRGKVEACLAVLQETGAQGIDAKETAEACIRCEPFTVEGTQGFFVAAFVRDDSQDNIPGAAGDSDSEAADWNGFDD